ncbi:MAG: hypothetical protein Unbinned3904contig1002_30 [Prokaryotic dsDNA virus sp.]|nr:MAG: hypothetical protein Unbinned3904contig1002_30 [Prokaryotic dsDNA virus sp.]|tara:strand:+ start:2318 stop:3151 length:834 start_codon:yes stop_codon:yes gene_type:complete
MKKYKLTKYKDNKDLIKTTPKEEHFDTVIKEDTAFYLDGECIGIYVNIDKKLLSYVRECVKDTKYVETYRTNALPTKSSVFGALPRVALRNDFCRFSNKTIEEKQNFNKLFTFQNTLCEIYKKYLPELYNYDLSKARELIDDDYRLVDTPYTTANINVNHAIKYHTDSGNIKGSFSNVLILKEYCTGGELVLPDYRIALEQSDGALCIFRGQEEIHGVMPLKPYKENFYRASIVYYTLAQLHHCYPYKEEVTRLNIKKRERAVKRSNNIDPRINGTK